MNHFIAKILYWSGFEPKCTDFIFGSYLYGYGKKNKDGVFRYVLKMTMP